MTPDQIDALRDLITHQRVLSLAVIVDGEPLTGLLPYAPTAELNALLIHASALARHSKGLAEGGRFAALIHREPGADGDPLQVERASLQGSVRVLERGSDAHDAGRRTYLSRFPHAEVTFGLGDFTLYALEPDRGRWVSGFASAVNLTSRNLAELGSGS
jgi:putative heme iron utilization protein